MVKVKKGALKRALKSAIKSGAITQGQVKRTRQTLKASGSRNSTVKGAKIKSGGSKTAFATNVVSAAAAKRKSDKSKGLKKNRVETGSMAARRGKAVNSYMGAKPKAKPTKAKPTRAKATSVTKTKTKPKTKPTSGKSSGPKTTTKTSPNPTRSGQRKAGDAGSATGAKKAYRRDVLAKQAQAIRPKRTVATAAAATLARGRARGGASKR